MAEIEPIGYGCSVCGKKIRASNTYGICSDTPECRAAKARETRARATQEREERRQEQEAADEEMGRLEKRYMYVNAFSCPECAGTAYVDGSNRVAAMHEPACRFHGHYLRRVAEHA